MISAIVLGVALLAFSASSLYLLSLAIMIPIGMGGAGRMTLSNSLIQTYTEDRYRGRVMSIYMMEFGLTSFSTFVAGVAAQVVGVQWTVGVTAFVLVLISVYCLVAMPRIRRLR